VLSLGAMRPERKSDSSLHLIPGLRMGGSVHSDLHMLSCLTQVQHS